MIVPTPIGADATPAPEQTAPVQPTHRTDSAPKREGKTDRHG